MWKAGCRAPDSPDRKSPDELIYKLPHRSLATEYQAEAADDVIAAGMDKMISSPDKRQLDIELDIALRVGVRPDQVNRTYETQVYFRQRECAFPRARSTRFENGAENAWDTRD